MRFAVASSTIAFMYAGSKAKRILKRYILPTGPESLSGLGICNIASALSLNRAIMLTTESSLYFGTSSVPALSDLIAFFSLWALAGGILGDNNHSLGASFGLKQQSWCCILILNTYMGPWGKYKTFLLRNLTWRSEVNKWSCHYCSTILGSLRSSTFAIDNFWDDQSICKF